MTLHRYKSKLKARARNLRKRMTKGEAILWNQLRRKQLGYRFYRQKPLLEFIVDFYCNSLKLVIEIDGSSHNEEKSNYDNYREDQLRQLGLEVLRFSEYDTVCNTNDVVESIQMYIVKFEKRF